MRLLPQAIACCLLMPAWLAGATAQDKWVKIETPHFKVLTTGTEAVARQWAGELEQFQLALQKILPVESSRLRPVTVVLFRSDKALRPFKPLEKGKPQEIAGFFSRLKDTQIIALALDYDADLVRGIIYHEAVHWYANASDRILPPWLEEGLAEVYSTFRPEGGGDRYVFGKLIPWHIELLQSKKLLPLEKLTTIPHGSIEYSDKARTSLFYAQSWGFTHYLLFGENTPGMLSVEQYLEAAEHGTSSAEGFQQAFGAGYAEMDRRLGAYVKTGRYHTYGYKVAPATSGLPPAALPASEGEVDLALGTLLLGARGERTPEALAYLQRAAALEPGRAEVWQALGEAALMANDYDGASTAFERSVAANSKSFYSYYGLGMARLQGAPTIELSISTGAVDEAAGNLRQAIRLNPYFVPAYIALAGLIPALEKPVAGDEALMERARVLAPDNALIDVALSACDFHAGRRAQARKRLGVVLATAGEQRDAYRLAAGMLKDDDWLQFGSQLDGLFKERLYAKAEQAIQAAMEIFFEPRYRDLLRRNLQAAQHSALLDAAVTAANAGKLTEATELLHKVDAATTDTAMKTEVRRLLLELEKMKAARR